MSQGRSARGKLLGKRELYPLMTLPTLLARLPSAPQKKAKPLNQFISTHCWMAGTQVISTVLMSMRHQIAPGTLPLRNNTILVMTHVCAP